MELGFLIGWLRQQDPELIVKDGFGAPHSDRGDYSDLAFDPKKEAKIGDMLKHAESALGNTFEGWKGGDYTMEEYTSVKIGEYGDCGDDITPIHLKYWLLTGRRLIGGRDGIQN